MQIIKLWFKLTAVLALLGWGLHTFSPGFAAWTDEVFKSKESVAAPTPAAKHTPSPAKASSQSRAKSEGTAPTTHKLNE